MNKRTHKIASMGGLAISLAAANAACDSGHESASLSPSDLQDSETAEDSADSTGATEDSSDSEQTADRAAPGTDQLTAAPGRVQDDDGGGVFYPVCYFTEQYFGGDVWCPQVPLSAATGTAWYYGNLPENFAWNVKSYNLKDDCGHFHYPEYNQGGHDVHGRTYYDDQYFALTGVPNFRSFKIRCDDARPERATFYKNSDYSGNRYRIFEDKTFTASEASALWSNVGLGSVILNSDYGDQNLILSNSGGVFYSIFRSISNIASRNKAKVLVTNIEGAQTVTYGCNPEQYCWFFDPTCQGDVDAAIGPVSLEECRQRWRGVGWCAPGELPGRGICVSPGTGLPTRVPR